jgi:hypothetical protein
VRNFSDPFAKAVYETISAGTAGCDYLELRELYPEDPDDPGQLRNTLQELRASGAITSRQGRYWAAQDDQPPQPAAKAAHLYKVETTYGTKPGFIATTIKENTISGTKKDGTRARVFEAIKQVGQGSRESIAEATGLSLQAVANALASLKFDGKLQLVQKGNRSGSAVYAPADSGRNPGADIERAVKGKKAGKAARVSVKPAKPAKKAAKPRAAAPVPALQPAPVRPSVSLREAAQAALQVSPGGFRVGLFSDGTLSIVDADCEMQIDQAKTRALFSYLDQFQRMLGGV